MLIVVKRPITKIPHYLSHADVALTMKVYALALLKAQEAGRHEDLEKLNIATALTRQKKNITVTS